MTFKNALITCAFAIGLGISSDSSITDKIPLKSQEIEPTTSQVYGSKIVYKDFSDLDFNIPNIKIDLPKDIEDMVNNYHLRVGDGDWLEDKVNKTSFALGTRSEDYSSLGIKDSILLARDITVNLLDYEFVDDLPFTLVYGKFLNLEEYVKLGKGDCDKYRDLFYFTFNTIKNSNPSLVNVYVNSQNQGGILERHAWNSIYLMDKDRIQVSHVDPTFFDTGGSFEAERGRHIPENEDHFRALLYKSLLDYRAAYEFFEKAQSKIDKKNRPELLAEMAFCGDILHSPDMVARVRGLHTALGTDEERDAILFYSYSVEMSEYNVCFANEFRKELEERFPDSFYTGLLKGVTSVPCNVVSD